MKKLQALTAALLNLGIAQENIQSTINKGYLQPQVTDLGHGLQVAVYRYDAVVKIKKSPRSSKELLAWFTLWLMEHDPEREYQDISDPKVSMDLTDTIHPDVTITVDFEEPIQIVPDENGLITYQEKHWKVADVPVTVAQQLVSMQGHLHDK